MPYNIYLIPFLGGLIIRDALYDPESLIETAMDVTDVVGDAQHPLLGNLDNLSLLPNCGREATTLHWKIWDHFPPGGNLPSSYFNKVMIEDYDDAIRRGFSTRLFSKKVDSSVFQHSSEMDVRKKC